MLRYDLASCAIGATKRDMYFAILDLSAFRRVSEKEGDLTKYLFLDEPSSRRSEVSSDSLKSQPLR